MYLKSNNLFLILFFTLAFWHLLLNSCANVSMPTGGPKDTIPPVLINSMPADNSINFNSNEIILNFNEAIQAQGLNQKLIVTPRLSEDIESKTKKTRVIIELNEELNDSTTYTFNFTDAIKDLTEGNVPPNLSLAFSTGNYIDSLSIAGRVYNLMTGLPIEEATVAIYKIGDTLDIFSGKPEYFSRTDTSGLFQIDNLKKDAYRIYAYLDENNNLINEPSKEKYGFLADTIIPTFEPDSSEIIEIPIQHLDISEFRIISNRPSGRYFDIQLSKPALDYKLSLFADSTFIIVPEDSAVTDSTINQVKSVTIYKQNEKDSIRNYFFEKSRDFLYDSLLTDSVKHSKNIYLLDSLNVIYSNLTENGKTIRIYQTFPVKDSIPLFFTARDSIGFTIKEKLYLEFRETKRKTTDFSENFSPADKSETDPAFEAVYTSSKPIRIINTDSIYIALDAGRISPINPEKDFFWQNRRSQLKIKNFIDRKLLNQIAVERENRKKEQQNKLKNISELDSIKTADSLLVVNRRIDSIITSNDSVLYYLELRESLKDTSVADSDILNQPGFDKYVIKRLREDIDLTNRLVIYQSVDSLIVYDSTLMVNSFYQTAYPDADDLFISETVADTIRTDDKNRVLKKLAQKETVKEIPLKGFKIFIPKGSFISVDLDSSKLIERVYTLKDSRDYGVIKGIVSTDYNSFVVQLLDEDFNLLQELINERSYVFADIPPGEYRIRILVDENNNGNWDPGNVLELSEPEPVIHYGEIIPVKENWELENEPIYF